MLPVLLLVASTAGAVPTVGDVKNDVDGFRSHAIGYLAGVRDTLAAELQARSTDSACEEQSSPRDMLAWILANAPDDLDLWRAAMAYFNAHCVSR